mmetsp:Transcript_35916/g.89359  ORF Transcript_35916/g.89359 Transcript_35916/m.89359 type:complete len:387 (-) Transcript_35916:289-1449(-)
MMAANNPMMGMGGMGAQANGGGSDARGGGGASGKTKAQKGPREPMSYEQKRKLLELISKLTPLQVAKVAEIVRRDSPHIVGPADELELDIDELADGTLWKLHDYVSTCKGVNAKKKAPGLTNKQMLDAAKLKAAESKQKISQLHRGAAFGAAPYMAPLMPRSMPSAGEGSRSKGNGSRKAPGFSMPAQMPSMPSKSASMGGPPKGAGLGDDSSSDSSDAKPAAPKPFGSGLPMPLGLAGRPKPGAAASSGGTAGGLLGKAGSALPNRAAWANLAKPAVPGGGAGPSRAWEQAVAARQAANAQKEQASLGQAAAQLEREAAAARIVEQQAQRKAQAVEEHRQAEQNAKDAREAARAAARAEREQGAGAAAEPAGDGYNFDDFNAPVV